MFINNKRASIVALAVMTMVAQGLSADLAVAGGSSPLSEIPGIPITRFREHSPGIFRGGRPEEEGVDAIHSQLGVRTIINIEDSKSEIRREEAQARELGITFVSNPMNAFDTPVDSEIDHMMSLIEDPSNYPIYVHCKAGKDRTGLVMGLHRVLFQGWEPDVAFKEMKDIGFSTMFRPLVKYFKKRTGMALNAKELEPLPALFDTELAE